MFELIRGAVSSLFPGPPRPGVFEPNGAPVSLPAPTEAPTEAPTGAPTEAAREEPARELAEEDPAPAGEARDPAPAEPASELGPDPSLPALPGEVGPSPVAIGEPVDLAGALSYTPPESAPPQEESVPLRLSVPQPRCPFCHEGIAPGVLQEACKACRAWHHEACWREGRSRCSACRAPAVTQTIRVRVGNGGGERREAGVDGDLAASWGLIAAGALAYSLIQIPLRSHAPGSLGYELSANWSAVPSLTALSCLFVASGLSPGWWRRSFHAVAWAVAGLTAFLAFYALFMRPVLIYDAGF